MTPLLGEATINELEGELQGSLIRPGDDAYEEARHIWNGAIDKRPAMVVRPAGTADVVRTVRFAASEGLPIAVRGGAHSVAGFSTCDDGIVVDLSAMDTVEVDATDTSSHRRRRDEVGRVRRRHTGAWPGHHRRPDLDHRARRIHARRRHRPPRAGPRPGLRQPARRRGGDRRRLGGASRSGRPRRAPLGPARWWRQLRRGDVDGDGTASGRADRARRPRVLRRRRRRGGRRRLARLRRWRARRAQLAGQPDHRTAGTVPARGMALPQDRRDRRVLGGRSRRRGWRSSNHCAVSAPSWPT